MFIHFYRSIKYFFLEHMVLCLCIRFTELYVEELESESDLRILVSDYLKGLNLSRGIIQGIIRFVHSSSVGLH